MEPLLPDFAGKRVLDLGCGYGWHCIYAAEHGAASVTGVDLSEKMLAVAREKTTAPQVTYIRGIWRRPHSRRRALTWSSVPWPSTVCLPLQTFWSGCGSACHPAATLSSLWSTPFSLLPVPRSGTTARTAPLRVVEPQPPARMLGQPGMRDELRRPMMLLVSARKRTAWPHGKPGRRDGPG